MRLTLAIAIRYLFGKKSTNAINIITWISMIGISIGSAALILILSVFNGFESLLTGMLHTFNPDIKVTLVEGKYYSKDSINLKSLQDISGIDNISFALEETAFFDYESSQEVGIIKGVDQEFAAVTGLDSSIIMGEPIWDDENQISYGLIGAGMSAKLAINSTSLLSVVTVYMPSKKSKGPLGKDFNTFQFHPSGIFSVGSDIDVQYIIVDIKKVNDLLNLENAFSSIEIKTDPLADINDIKSQIVSVLGDKFYIKDRYQQDENFLKIMNIEKWVSFLIVCLTLLIVSFNLVGSLWMIVLEKQQDISILQSLGMFQSNIKSIFLLLGLIVTASGLVLGLSLGFLLYVFQKYYGLVGIPEGFLIDAYPIEWRWLDVLTVSITVMVIGYFTSLLPSLRATKIKPYITYE